MPLPLHERKGHCKQSTSYDFMQHKEQLLFVANMKNDFRVSIIQNYERCQESSNVD